MRVRSESQLEWHRNYQRRSRERWRAEGRCTQCGSVERRVGLLLCAKCAANQSRSKHTTAERERLMTIQDGRCAICQSKFTRTPHGDHNHSSRRKRGLLCTRCNQLVGHIETRPWLIDAAYRYLDLMEGDPK